MSQSPLTLADQHDRRRGEGLPTISSLVGPVALGQRLWRTWAERHARVPVVVVGGTVEKWFCEWVRTLVGGQDLYLDAERYLAQRISERRGTALSLREKTSHELGLAFEAAELADDGVGADRLCRWLLLRRAGGQTVSADDLVQAQMNWAETSAGVIDAFRQLLDLVPSVAVPPLLVIPHIAIEPCSVQEAKVQEVNASPIASMQSAVQQLVNLAIGVPRLSVALAAEETSWSAFIERAHESFAKAVVQEHVIQVRGWTADQVRHAVATRTGRNVDVLEQIFDEVARIGASMVLVQSLSEALMDDSAGRTLPIDPDSAATSEQASSDLPGDEQDPWKSAQEWFLFQLLEHTTDLAGRFQLNGHPGFLFGNQGAEVDLLCPSLKIAVEIDGYYHFTDPDRYRRDRRKDVELQRHDFLVLRFLAEDVVPRMVTVLDSIRAAVRFRESQRARW